METAVSLIASVLWSFLICNIAILKKDLAASFLGILFSLTLGWSGCISYSCLSAEFTLPYLVNAVVKYLYQVLLPIFFSQILALVVLIDH